MTKVISLDFELGGVLDLADVGADVWTKDKDTVPILAGFALDYDEPECIDFEAAMLRALADDGGHVFYLENELLNAIAGGAEIHAWNAAFEWAVWNNICVPRFRWPELPIERFYCTMCAAACAGLPMSLADAALAVGSPFTKDLSGHNLMKRMSRPRRVDPDGTIRWWHREDPTKLAQLIAYNLDDVRAEREVHYRTPRMTRREREIWLADQRMNQRGLPVDTYLLNRLGVITQQELARLNAGILRVTKGVVSGSTQNLRLLAWVQGKGYPHTTLAKDELLDFIGSPWFYRLDQDAQDVLMLRAEAAKTSIAKLRAINDYARIDGRARNLVQYGGAVRTLRWAGRGPQIQNFPKPVIKHVPEAINEILNDLSADSLRLLFGRPLDVVSSCLRGVFKAPAGKSFVVADYHAIEAIVVAWLADFRELLDVFRRGEDVYVFTAQGVGSNNRQLGKVLRLACAFGMGHIKFVETAASYGLVLTLAEAHAAVQAFRTANRPIVELWHACERSAGNAILNPATTYTFKRLKFRMARPDGRLKGSLLIELPSGRNLVYRNARVDNGKIVFWGVDQYTRQWKELSTYGGKIVENTTQACARDLLADAVVELDAEFPDTIDTTVHDEIIAECPDGDADELLRGMLSVMSVAPLWARGMPLSAAGKVLKRYAKL